MGQDAPTGWKPFRPPNAGESIIPTPKDTRLEETTEENEAQERTVVREGIRRTAQAVQQPGHQPGRIRTAHEDHHGRPERGGR